MIPSNRIPTHPGEILLKEYIEPLGISQSKLSIYLNIPIQRINEIIRKKRGVSPKTAWLLSQAFDTTPEFWLHLQDSYNLALEKPKRKITAIAS